MEERGDKYQLQNSHMDGKSRPGDVVSNIIVTTHGARWGPEISGGGGAGGGEIALQSTRLSNNDAVYLKLIQNSDCQLSLKNKHINNN